MTACSDAVYFVTIVVVVLGFVLWTYLTPKPLELFKVILHLVFSMVVWNHIYVAWAAPEIADKAPSQYAAFSGGAMDPVLSLLPALFVFAILITLGKYMALVVSTALILIVTKHLYFWASFGTAIAVGVFLQFVVLYSSEVQNLASILVVSLQVSLVSVYLAVSLAVNDGTSSTFSLHPLPNTLGVNQTLQSVPQRGANCSAHFVNLLVVCDSNCPVVSDLEHQPEIMRTIAATVMVLAIVRVLLLLLGCGGWWKRKDKAQKEDEVDKDLEERSPCFCWKRACETCTRIRQKRQNRDAASNVAYNPLELTGVSTDSAPDDGLAG
jgi:hypothetical protein